MWQFTNFINLHAGTQFMVAEQDALPGRPSPLFPVQEMRHAVLGTALDGSDAPEGAEVLILAGGCYWGIERVAWRVPGVHTTAAGYAGGFTPNPTYKEVCTAKTGHTEAVRVVYTGGAPTLRAILEQFWQQHDPTTENRQGNDVGTQYRSALYWTNPEQEAIVRDSLAQYQTALTNAHRGTITTQLLPLNEAGHGEFYYAEPEHQQYLEKNPGGYCNHGFNGVACRLG